MLGIIGPGLLVSSGNALHEGGPAGSLISFSLVGIIVFFVMSVMLSLWFWVVSDRYRQSLGEMATVIPVTGSFIEYAERFIDDALSFALGWAYWYLWVTVRNDLSFQTSTSLKSISRSSQMNTTRYLLSSSIGLLRFHNGAGFSYFGSSS